MIYGRHGNINHKIKENNKYGEINIKISVYLLNNYILSIY